MSLYLPPIDSYTIIEPELFVEESFLSSENIPEFKPQKRGRNKGTIRLPPIVTEEDISRPDLTGSSRLSTQSFGHHVGKSLNLIKSDDLSLSEFTSDKSSTSVDWATLREIVYKDKRKKRRLENRRRTKHAKSLFEVVAKFATRQGVQGDVFMNYVSSVRYSPEELKDKFRHAVRIMMILRTMAVSISKKAGQGTRTQTFTDMANDVDETSENMKNQGLSFDPSYFKAKKEISISSEVKNILNLPSEERTMEQIQTAMFGLQSLRSFAEYPLHMQEKLAKVAWYEIVPPKRVIIRQGHYAENFYFILSGQAVVTILVRDPKTGGSAVRTATIMRKGMSFGELALLHHSRRTATVTSQDTVQLLTIGRDDFFDIFMSGQGPDQMPDHIKFVSQCDFMKDFPIDKLLESPERCLLHFFKRNVVIVKDSRVSDWLYVVKSGSCQVLKSLRGVTARLGYSKKDANVEEMFKLPSLATGEQGPKIETGIRRRKKIIPPVMPPSSLETETKNEDSNKSEKEDLSDNEKFSKSKYSQRPHTRRAHFSVTKRRQQYKIPKKNKPPPPPTPEVSRDKPQPVFVQVEHLKPRDSFGLNTIQFDDDLEIPSTSVSLVSRGAECIMLSKEFFVKHASENVKKRIRQQMRPYPAEETFQENLQIKANWEFYKHVMIEDLTSAS